MGDVRTPPNRRNRHGERKNERFNPYPTPSSSGRATPTRRRLFETRARRSARLNTPSDNGVDSPAEDIQAARERRQADADASRAGFLAMCSPKKPPQLEGLDKYFEISADSASDNKTVDQETSIDASPSPSNRTRKASAITPKSYAAATWSIRGKDISEEEIRRVLLFTEFVFRRSSIWLKKLPEDGVLEYVSRRQLNGPVYTLVELGVSGKRAVTDDKVERVSRCIRGISSKYEVTCETREDEVWELSD